jgi:hypothetical protein
MSENQKVEVQKLLWCYLKTPNSEIPAKVEKLKEYLEREKIPLTKLQHAFKETCGETHLRAIEAVTKVTVLSLQRKRMVRSTAA